MAKKRNAKNAQHSASRALLMSGLVVAAITGVTPAMAATVTVDNSTTGEWKAVSGSIETTSDVVTKDGAKLYSNTPTTIKSLHVKNAQFYVGSGGLTVSGSNVPGHSNNVLVSDNGKLYVGATYSATVAGGDLTADNMSINGVNALVEVSQGKTLTLKSGNLDIIQGTLSLKNGIVKVEKGNVNIETLGTLSAEGKSGNLVNASGSVNLNGGKIVVAKGGGLTFGTSAAVYDTYLNAQASGAANGVLVVKDGKTFNSRGGKIQANMVVTDANTKANFETGTTTVDNLTVEAGGVTTIAGGAIVDVITEKVTVDGSGSKIEMKGGTLNIAGGMGTLVAQNSGELAASAGVNTLNGNVSLISNGKLSVSGTNTSLTITKDLTVGVSGVASFGSVGVSGVASSGSVTIAETSSLNVKKDLKIENGTVSVSGNLNVAGNTSAKSTGTLEVTGKGIAAITAGSLLNTDLSLKSDNYAGQLKVSTSGGLMLTGLAGKTITKAQYDTLVASIAGLSGSGISGNNLALIGVTVEGLEVSGDGTGTVITGNEITLTNGNGNSITGNYGAPTLKLQSGNALSVANSGSLTLMGTNGGAFIKGETTAPVALAVASGGTLNVGFEGQRTNGSLGTLETSGTVNVTNGTTLTINETKLTGGNLNVIGSIDAPTNVDLGTLTASGGRIFVNPAYVTASGISGSFASELALGLDGKMNVGANDGWMQKQLQLANYNKSGGALGLREQLKVSGNGRIIVDHNLLDTGGVLSNSGSTDFDVKTASGSYFGEGSLLVVDANIAANANGAISLSGITATNGKNITINNDAQLRLSNALGNTTYTIVSGAGSITSGSGNGWNGANLSIDTDMLAGKTTFNADGTITTSFDVRNASDVYANLDGDMAGMINSLYLGKLNGNVNNPNRGIAFLTRATRGEFLDKSETARVVEGAARMGAIAGVQTMTMTAATAGTSAATSRTAMASPLMSQTPKALALNENGTWTPEGVSAGNTGRTGVSLWIMPLYQSANKWGMKAGEFKTGLSGDLGGVAIGADYTIDEAIRVGLAFNMGGGYAQSKGDFSKTDNNFNFWGVNLYGGWTQNNFGLTADVGYTSSFNAVKQELPSSMQMGELKADVTSTALTAGLRGEYKFETESVDIIPHVGVRFMSLDTYEFDTKSGGTVFKNDQTLQNIWTFPIGVTFAKDITSESGWNFKPQVDLQVIPAAGDVKAKSKVKVAGLQSAELNTRIMDDISYGGGIGLNLQKDNISFGVNYNILMGEHTTDHGVYGTFRYEF